MILPITPATNTHCMSHKSQKGFLLARSKNCEKNTNSRIEIWVSTCIHPYEFIVLHTLHSKLDHLASTVRFVCMSVLLVQEREEEIRDS